MFFANIRNMFTVFESVEIAEQVSRKREILY